MNNSVSDKTDHSKRIGIAADHGGFELKKYLLKILPEIGFTVIDFGNTELKPEDDYPDYIIPLAKAVAGGMVIRGIAVCGSGVGACIAANKIAGVRACLIHEKFSAQQGVEDDDMNLICLGGRVLDPTVALELTTLFLVAKYKGSEKYDRRLAKIKALEKE